MQPVQARHLSGCPCHLRLLQEERAQHLELLAGQAEMRAAELAAAQAAAASGGRAEEAAEAGEQGKEEDGGSHEEEQQEEGPEDSQQDAEQEWAAQQEAANASSAAPAAGPQALSSAAARLQTEDDAAADSNHASPTRHSPNTLWRDTLPSVMRLPPLRLSPKSQLGGAGGASRHTAHGGRRYAPY